MKDAERRLPGKTPRRDVCVVGGGPAGISLALRLEEAGLSVLLLESGSRRETATSRDLNRGAADPQSSHEPLEENRRRQWGGASAVWGGRCIPFDEIDFTGRAWVPHSGWPFERDELEPFYEEAVAYCEAGPMSFDARTALPGARELLPGLDGGGIVSYPLERWSPPTHFGKRYRRRLAASRLVTVLLNATCTQVQLTESGDSVDHLIVAIRNRQPLVVRATTYVIAAGGLENARLLLSSDDIAPSGIGNHSGALGRYYQTHLFGCGAAMTLNGKAPRANVAFDRDADGVYCRRRIWITPEQQEVDRLLNIVFFPVRPPAGATGHRNAVFSGTYLMKTLAAAFRRPGVARELLRGERDALAGHARVVVRDLPSPGVSRLGIGLGV